VEDAHAAGQVILVLDGGDALYKDVPVPKELLEQSQEKAAIIAKSYGRVLDAFVPGERDVANGVPAFRRLADEHQLPVIAANLTDAGGKRAFPSYVVKKVGRLSVLIAGAVSLEAWPTGAELVAQDPVEALRETMRVAPAHDVAILMAHASVDEAAQWATAVPHFSSVMASHTGLLTLQPKFVALPAGGAVASTLVLSSGKGGKYLARLRVSHRDGEPTYLGGEPRQRLRSAVDQKRPDAEQARADLAEQDRHSHADFDLLGFETSMPEDPAVAAAVKAYNDVNSRREAALVATSGPPPSEIPGSSPFVGVRVCSACHLEQYRVWQGSDHSHAMASLRRSSQQLDRECIGCHTTGFDRAGGFKDPVSVGPFAEVQCEACHDAGREHVQQGAQMNRAAGEGVCRQCHTQEATPQFEFAKDRLRIRHWKGP
jgi:predicted CXXCH cytochrome family protein